MSFTISGSTITQSGTDNSLSGLAAISGVTLTAFAERSVYALGTNTLVINGTLNVDPAIEQINCSSASGRSVQVNGTLNINGQKSINGADVYDEDIWLEGDIVAVGNNRFSENYSILHVGNNATLNWLGGKIRAGKTLFFAASASINIRQAGFISIAASTFESMLFLRFLTNNNFSIDGFSTKGGASISTIGTEWQALKGLRPIGVPTLFGASSLSSHTYLYVAENYQAEGTALDMLLYNEVAVRYRDSLSGTDLAVSAAGGVIDGFGTASNNKGTLEVTKQVKFDLFDDVGAVQQAAVYMKDYNNGSRKNTFVSSSFIYGQDYTPDRVYETTSDATGETEILEVLTGVWTRNDGGSADVGVAQANLGQNTPDRRSKYNDARDVFEFFLASYQHALKSIEVSLKGLDVLTVTDKLFPDVLITEQDAAVVAAYTEIDTTGKLYDRAKLYLKENYAGESDTLVTRTQDTIDLHDYNIVLDATAANAFSIAGNTITIKSMVFTGNLVTTGTVTLTNGASLEGVYADATQNAAVSIVGVNLTPNANTLEVSQDGGTTWTTLDNNVYAYLANPSQSVKFRYTKGEGEFGDPIVTTDDYALEAGTNNSFMSFTNETGQLLQAQTTTLINAINNISVSGGGGLTTEQAAQLANTATTTSMQQRFERVDNLLIDRSV